MGFNSLKLVNYDVRTDRSFSVLEKETVPTRLGKGIDPYGYLTVDAILRVVDGLKLFGDILSLESINQVIGVATSGVRDSVNRDAFLQTVKRETGFTFKVLSGRDEALYSFKGALNSVTSHPNILFFDIGGGSLEIVHFENYTVKRVYSLPLGGLRLTNMFSGKRRSYEKMQDHILDSLPTRNDLHLKGDTVLLGVGGTLRALARFEQEESDYPLNKIHNYVMKFDSIRYVHDRFREMKPKELEENDSIGPSRADTIVAGSLVIELLMEVLDFDQLTVSTHGLRDGILASFLENKSWQRSTPNFSADFRAAGRRSKSGEPMEGLNNHFSPDSVGLIDSFVKRRLIAEKQRALVSFTISFLLLRRPLYSAETVFDTIIDQDSNLSHEDQLLLALIIVRTMSAKSTDRLVFHYKSLLRPKTKSVVKKLASFSKFVEFVEKTGCHVALEAKRQGLNLRITPNNLKRRETFPRQLLAKLVADLSEAFAIELTYEINEKLLAEVRARHIG